MIVRVILLCLFLPSLYLFAEERSYELIEKLVFKSNSIDFVKGLYTNRGGMGDFQNALVDYRLANMTTNVDLMRKSLSSISNNLDLSTNVFNITYFGMIWSGIAMQTPNLFEKLPSLGQSFSVLDRAVELYPVHYLPRFYRSILKLMVPSFVGGNEDVGKKDMEFVLSNMSSIKRENNYKAFIHFFYAIYWGEMKNDMIKAESLLSNADRLAETEEMRTNILKYRKKYEEKRGHS